MHLLIDLNRWREICIKPVKSRLILWAAASLVLVALLLIRANWPVLISTLSFNYIVNSHHVAPWGVVMLAVLMIYAQRKQIRAAMEPVPAPVFIAAGLALIGLAFFVPLAEQSFLLRLLTGCVGAFAVFLGAAVAIPLVLLATYAFTIYFPLLVETYFEAGYASTSVVPVAGLFHLFGLHIASQGQIFQFMTPAHNLMRITVSSACAGPTTMAVFVVIFTLMMLDLPLPWPKAIPVFLFGVVGTWLQNVIRIVIILCCGYFIGDNALWTAHFWTIYVLFPLWYLMFAVIYFRFVKRPPASPPAKENIIA